MACRATIVGRMPVLRSHLLPAPAFKPLIHRQLSRTKYHQHKQQQSPVKMIIERCGALEREQLRVRHHCHSIALMKAKNVFHDFLLFHSDGKLERIEDAVCKPLLKMRGKVERRVDFECNIECATQ